MKLSDIQIEAYQTAKRSGFWDYGEGSTISAKLMLIVSEIAEALEEHRDPTRDIRTTYYTDSGKPEGFGIELADAIIRISDLAESINLSLTDLVAEKMKYNKTRPFKHDKTM